MEIAILKRESVGNGPNLFNENETIAKYEIMDGAPVKGRIVFYYLNCEKKKNFLWYFLSIRPKIKKKINKGCTVFFLMA